MNDVATVATDNHVSSTTRHRWMQALALMLGACAVTGLCIAAYVILQSPPYLSETAGLFVPDIELGSVAATPKGPNTQKRIHPLTLSFINRGLEPIAIVGVEGGCRVGGCCWYEFGDRIEIAPGKTVYVSGEFECSEGPFNIPLSVHYDHNGLQTAVYHIRGFGIAAPQSP